ncbi:MAG: hypothetical protein CVU06_10065 [Bacteroidetes bacterium HGW-Bacteroidetes-22]|nr:MAG: hypothetical protein CVU06_10065 [Bacteroidetes bacterium HGW-Bacteroidetes-22]
MSLQQQLDADKILHDLFANLKTESPSEDFTRRLMTRISPEFIHQESIEPFKISGRIWLAIFVSVVFFSLLFFTSDIPAFDFLNKYLDFRWLADFTISDRSTLFFQKMVSSIEGIKLNYILIPFMALLGLIGIDRVINHKAGNTTFFTFL